MYPIPSAARLDRMPAKSGIDRVLRAGQRYVEPLDPKGLEIRRWSVADVDTGADAVLSARLRRMTRCPQKERRTNR